MKKNYWNSLVWVFHIFTEYTLVAYVTSNNCDKSGIKQLRYNILLVNAWSGYVHVNHSRKCFKQIIILTFIDGSKWKHSSSTVSCYSRHKILHNNVFYQLHNIFTKKDEPCLRMARDASTHAKTQSMTQYVSKTKWPPVSHIWSHDIINPCILSSHNMLCLY